MKAILSEALRSPRYWYQAFYYGVCIAFVVVLVTH